MKRLMQIVLIFGVLSFIALQEASAQDATKQDPPKAQTNTDIQQTRPFQPGPGFIDADGDGICDNYNGTQPGKGTGICQFRGNGRGMGYMRNTGNIRNGNQIRGQGQGRGQGLGTGPLRNGTGPYCIYR